MCFPSSAGFFSTIFKKKDQQEELVCHHKDFSHLQSQYTLCTEGMKGTTSRERGSEKRDTLTTLQTTLESLNHDSRDQRRGSLDSSQVLFTSFTVGSECQYLLRNEYYLVCQTRYNDPCLLQPKKNLM